jgi:hypothetical protein
MSLPNAEIWLVLGFAGSKALADNASLSFSSS